MPPRTSDRRVIAVPRLEAPTLESARLRLRAWQADELAWYVALRADPEVSRFIGLQSAGEASTDFEWATSEWARTGLGGWAVEERSTGTLAGYLGLPLWRAGAPEEAVEIGYGYARDAWGKGYATEAAAAALRWAFEARGLDSLVALTSPEHHASQHVLAKVGFTRDGEAEGQHGRASFFRVTRATFEASTPFRGLTAGTVVETPRLRLRQWRESDLDAFAAIEADPEFRRNVGTRQPLTRREAEAELREFREEWRRLGHGRLAVEDRVSGRLAGLCGVLLYREGTPDATAEVAYGLAPEWWGRGLATEAARAAIGWAFERFPYASMVGLTHPENVASQRVLAKLGFEPEGNAMGRYYLARLFRLQRARFEAQHATSD